jgi:thiol-disulfide isomerase/thioredoxin
MRDFTVKETDGSTSRSPSTWQEDIVLDIWATWCVPCLAAMPPLESLA